MNYLPEFYRISGIYGIRGPNGKLYVGQAVQMGRRMSHHRFHLRTGSHRCPPLQAAWNKHGEHTFTFEVLVACAVSELLEQEEHFMRENANALYNTSPARWNSNYLNDKLMKPRPSRESPSQATRDQISKALKGRVQPQSEIDNRREVVAVKVVLANGLEYPTLVAFAKACGYSRASAVSVALGRGDTFDQIAKRRNLF